MNGSTLRYLHNNEALMRANWEGGGTISGNMDQDRKIYVHDDEAMMMVTHTRIGKYVCMMMKQ